MHILTRTNHGSHPLTSSINAINTDLVKERNLLSNLSRCLLETLRSASFVPGTPGAPPPAGSFLDAMNDRNNEIIAPSSSLTATVLALLGFFGQLEEGEDVNVNAERLQHLDSEIEDLLLHGGLGTGDDSNVGGGDSRHHGHTTSVAGGHNSSLQNDSREGSQRYNARDLLERTSALVPPTLAPAHIVLSHRRYSVCISDLKCVLNVDGMSRHFASFPIVVDEEHNGGSKHHQSMRGSSVDYLVNKGASCALDDWIKVSILYLIVYYMYTCIATHSHLSMSLTPCKTTFILCFDQTSRP